MGKGNIHQAVSDEVGRLKQIEQELKERLHQQAAISELSQAALTATDLQELMDETAQLVSKTLDVEFCKILELQPDGKEFLLNAGAGWKDGLVGKATVSAALESQAGFTLVEGKPVIVPDLKKETRFSGPQLLLDHGVVSGMSVIIPGREHMYGVLGAHTSRLRSFSMNDTNFLQGVANVLASAIERFRINTDLRFSRDQLAVILEGVADGITVQDLTGKLLYANTAAARLNGFSTAEEMVNTPLSELMEQYELLDEAGNLFNLENLPGRKVLQGEPSASASIRYRIKKTGEERWAVVKSTPVISPSGKVDMVVNIFQDVTEEKNIEKNQRFLLEAGKILASSLDYETTMKSVAALAVSNIADWCSVDMVEENGSARSLAVAHKDSKKVELANELHRRYPPDWNASAGSPNVLRTGIPEFYPDITDEMLQASAKDEEHLRLIRSLDLHSAFVLPLVARGRTLGALTLFWAESKHHYNQQDIDLAEELARRSAIAIDNASLYREAQNSNIELEYRVNQRTTQLQALIAKLHSEIDERKKAEQALRQSETMLSSLFESAPDAIILVDQEGNIARVNNQAEKVFGYLKEDLIGHKVDDLLPSRYRRSHPFYRFNYLQENKTRPMGEGIQLYAQRKDGSEFPVDIMLSPIQTPLGVQVICAIRDITDRKQMEAELAEVQRRLIDSLEAERLYLAQELHDSAIQDLYTITFSLKELEDAISKGNLALDEYLSTSKEGVHQVISLLRSICGELRPPALAPFGLEKAIRSHAEHINETHPNLKVELDLVPDGQKLPEQVRLALYRIYQHAVSNVLRHSEATILTIAFNLDDRGVFLEIRDNGRGFELPARWIELARRGHLGLVGTTERAQAIGGQLKITSSPGQGTTIQVSVPNPGGKETLSPEAFPYLRSN